MLACFGGTKSIVSHGGPWRFVLDHGHCTKLLQSQSHLQEVNCVTEIRLMWDLYFYAPHERADLHDIGRGGRRWP